MDDQKQPGDVAEDTSPLSQGDLVGMFINQVPEAQVIEKIKSRSVSFKVDPGMIDQMRQNHISENVISALQAAPVKEARAVARNPTTRRKPRRPRAIRTRLSRKQKWFPKACMAVRSSRTAAWKAMAPLRSGPSDDQLFVHLSTQNVSGVSTEYAQALKIPASNVRIHQDHVGGGFGSKFGADRWGIYTAEVSKKAGGKPVRVMLERAPELELAGAQAFSLRACKSRRKKRWHVAGLGI